MRHEQGTYAARVAAMSHWELICEHAWAVAELANGTRRDHFRLDGVEDELKFRLKQVERLDDLCCDCSSFEAA